VTKEQAVIECPRLTFLRQSVGTGQASEESLRRDLAYWRERGTDQGKQWCRAIERVLEEIGDSGEEG
jgi:hypothetical protein